MGTVGVMEAESKVLSELDIQELPISAYGYPSSAVWTTDIEAPRARHLPPPQLPSAEGEETSGLVDLKYWQQRTALSLLLSHFETVPLSFGQGEGCLANATSAEAARCFLRLIPVSRDLPRAAPDGDGDITLAWENGDRTVLLSVERWKLHAVIDPGTPRSIYIADVLFDGETIPNIILEHLPRREPA